MYSKQGYCVKQTNSNSLQRFNINNSIRLSFSWRFFFKQLHCIRSPHTSCTLQFRSYYFSFRFFSLGSCLVFLFNNSNRNCCIHLFHNTLICIVYQIECVKGCMTLKSFFCHRCWCCWNSFCVVIVRVKWRIPRAIIIWSAVRVMLYSL